MLRLLVRLLRLGVGVIFICKRNMFVFVSRRVTPVLFTRKVRRRGDRLKVNVFVHRLFVYRRETLSRLLRMN